MARTLLIGIAIVLLVLGGAGFYYLRGLNAAGVDSFSITGVNNISPNSFTLTADLIINNPSNTPVPVRSVTYDVILKDTGESIARGTVNPFTLAPNAKTTLPLEQTILWGPTAQLAVLLATQESVYLTVAGDIIVDLPEVRNHPIPFSDEIDIKEKITGTPSQGGGGILRGFETSR